jgi:hypothetical protein
MFFGAEKNRVIVVPHSGRSELEELIKQKTFIRVWKPL